MTESDFAFLRDFLRQRSGLAIAADKRYLVTSRLTPLCRRLAIASLGSLAMRLRLGGDADLERQVVEAMTTNETFFFRDRTPFKLIRDVLLPELMVRRAACQRLRIWCAAASTGQEPYSLAMTIRSMAPRLENWTVDILATDLSTEAIERAKAGIYSQFEVQRGLPIQLLLQHFHKVGQDWRIAPELRAMVRFKQLNLLRDFSHLDTFDIILCRNVLIYFDVTTKAEVLDRLARRMAPDAALILGATETVLGLSDAFAPHPLHRGLYLRAGQRCAVSGLRHVAGALAS
jgi:chemotaxis protein methyltransferase CheR